MRVRRDGHQPLILRAEPATLPQRAASFAVAQRAGCWHATCPHSRLRKPALSQSERTLPGNRALLASTAECTPPTPEHSFPEFAETVEVPRYRVVCEVALHNRFLLPHPGDSLVCHMGIDATTVGRADVKLLLED
jgi:hypothetical protein